MRDAAVAGLPPGPPALSLALRCERSACATAQVAFEGLLEPFQPSPRLSFALDLVLEELLMNQVLHAHPQAVEPSTVGLQAWVVDDALVLHFTDSGIPFDPLSRPEVVAPASLDDARPGGLGLHLVRRYARELAYQRVGDTNHLSVVLALR